VAYKIAVEEHVKRGTLSRPDADYMIATTSVRLTEIVQQRDSNAAAARANSVAAYGAFLQGVGVWQQSMQPARPAASGLITCSSSGTLTTCW
jgi:hypothetical protein